MNIEKLSKKFCEYSLYIKGYSKHTTKRYKYVVRYYASFTGIEKIEDACAENIRNMFYDGRTNRNWSPNTFIQYHKTLNVFFRWCITEGYIKENPIVDVEVPKLDKRLPTRLTKQQAMRLLEIVYNYPYGYTYLRYRNHAIFSMFIFAGLRKGELLKLKYTDVDLENMTISVSKGKGGKDWFIPMCSTLVDSLENYVTQRVRGKKTCPEFFASLNRNMEFTDSGLKHLIRRIQKSSGIDFSSHKLRHTFATLMLEGGCDIYSLSKMMGHSDIKTTTIYLAASTEHLRGEMMKHPLNDSL